ncbi:MAG: TonB-dependent receptor [Hyphomonadaceae bacterium]|nr:TonB-dependent receptor [Hyphomonadaceae bacterium]
MTIKVSRSLIAAALMGVSGWNIAALAQSTDESATAEADDATRLKAVRVTAQRREQDLVDVPVAVTAFGAEQLEQRGVTDYTQIASSVPNMQFEEVQSQRNQRIIIRGISSDTRFAGSESAVGVVVDGVSLAGVAGLTFDLADIEQIEVLRGPQGTLYGRNTAAGVINVFTTKPGNEFAASATAEYGNYDHTLLKGYVRGPLIQDQLYAGVSIISVERDGFETLLATGEDVNTRDTQGIRGQLRWTPAPDWDFRLIAEYQEDDFSQQRGQDDVLEPIDRELTSVPYRPMADREMEAYSLTIDKEFETVSVRSITSNRSYQTHELDSNLAVAGQSFVDRLNVEESNEFTQEFQINSVGDNRVDWVAGAYYLNQQLTFDGQYGVDIDGIYGLLFGPTAQLFGAPGNLAGDVPFFGGDPCPLQAPACVGTVPAVVSWTFKTTSLAGFGQAGIEINDRLTLDIGARYSNESKDFVYDSLVNTAIPGLPGFIPDGVVFIAGRGNPNFGAPLPYTDTIENDVWTTRVALTYAVNDENNIYVSAAQGSKSGTFFANILGISDGNGNGINDNVEFLRVEPESSWNYEIGAKGQLGIFGYAGALYYIDYKDLQTQRTLPLLASTVQILGNADATSYGAELELTAALTDHLTVDFGIGYNETEFQDYPDCAPGQDCDGNELVYAPHLTSSLGLSYNRPLSEQYNLFSRFGATYRGEQYYAVTNDPLYKGGSATLLDATLGIQTSDARWSVALWGRNLADEDYVVGLAPDQIGTNVTLGVPRTYGIRVSAKY